MLIQIGIILCLTALVNAACEGVFEGPSGIIQSPKYPNNYDNNLDCTYNITIPEGQVKLTFEAFDVESGNSCGYDYLEILEGTVSKEKFCGKNIPSYSASSNSVTLRFKTDSSIQKSGWKLKYERITCEYTCLHSSLCDRTSNDDYCPGVGQVCCEPELVHVEGCGIRNENAKESRIVGGNHASEHEWPWQASLQTTSGFHFCGATLINERWALTAAHCVDGQGESEIKVVLGEHHVNANEEVTPPVTRTVSKIFMHENYNGNGGGFPNDIALLKFTEQVSFTDQIVPACLPTDSSDLDDDENDCWISGWGNTQGGPSSEKLNELKVDVITNAVCARKWGGSYINAGHVCLNNGLTGACNGDSGGPLSCKGSDGKWYVHGATSWGRSGCQTEGYPSVYSRVTFFRSWILGKINDE